MSFSDEEWHTTAVSRRNYRAFLLRCWQEKSGDQAVWRFTLVQINGGQNRYGFAGLKELVSYLSDELDLNADFP